ncbi:olfactory receptor 1009-like [Hyla sarda]|uniref:olfactory receptor 1009-like n=1 Tax=Hyla sarda TaxID=327740 RepID=UPI0024C27F43|nr:olfactory receptor 1009-like [Hyla sarda]
MEECYFMKGPVSRKERGLQWECAPDGGASTNLHARYDQVKVPTECLLCAPGVNSSFLVNEPDVNSFLVNEPDVTVRIRTGFFNYFSGIAAQKEAYGEGFCLHLSYIQENNRTEVTEFLLLGFQVSRGLKLFLFCLFLVVYCLIICWNLLIITLVSISKNLHTPMYYFISHLSISDILLSTDIVPNMLHILLNNGGTMTFIGCITQYNFFSSSEAFECFLLTVMSYDRYVAICNPLRYSSIMTSGHCVILTVICWLFGFSVTLIPTITAAKLKFCGSYIIDHLFCDLLALLELSCSDTSIVHLELYVLSIPVILIPTTIIVLSYNYIVLAILKIPSNTGRQKAFSTCSSHLIVVSIFYGTLFGVYVIPTKGRTLTMSKILSLLYTVFTPLVNPIIYSLRNKDIKEAVQETIQKREIW